MVMFIKKNFLSLFLILISIFSIFYVSSVSAKYSDIEKAKNIKIGDKEVNLKYEYSDIEVKGKKLLVYKDVNDNEYVMKGDDLVGFLESKKITKDYVNKSQIVKKYSTSKIKSLPLIASTGINLDGYIQDSINYIESYGETTYTYSKYINDIKTNDGVYISLNSDGSLSAYSAPRQGLFDKLTTNVTSEDVTKYINDKIRSNFNDINFDIDNIYIDYVDEKYVVVCNVSLDYGDYIDSITMLYDL